MPKQHTCFGHPIRLPPRRFLTLFGTLGLLTIALTIFSVGGSTETLTKFAEEHKIPIPNLNNPWAQKLNPFKPPVHAPPRQKNDTNGESHWYADYKWLLHPFSASVTLDEARTLLPPYANRPPIYCYYDSTIARNAETKTAESELLLTWRRAWWAKGFRPTVLSEAEAMNNPSYQKMRLVTESQEIDSDLKNEIMRWLAFENMGGGILAHHLVFPMARYDDPLFRRLRTGNYPFLKRWEHFGNAMFIGSHEDVTKVVAEVLANPHLDKAEDFVSSLNESTFEVEPSIKALAFYEQNRIALYGAVANEAGAERINMLNKLINGHLHVSWQNAHRPSGIRLLHPKVRHRTSEMVAPGLQLANWLSQCPDTPVPQSCPPNQPDCTPCEQDSRIKIVASTRYDNSSAVAEGYTIATVPHPLTLAMLYYDRDHLDSAFIRNTLDRDDWIESLIPSDVSMHKLFVFKEAVAGDDNVGRSLWLEAEKGEPDTSVPASLGEALAKQVDLDWHFGFTVPRRKGVEWADIVARVEVEGGSGGYGKKGLGKEGEKEGVKDGKLEEVGESYKQRERELLKKAREVGKSRVEGDKRLRGMVEAWCMQDTEAWRFARAFRGREEVEREKFEGEEKKFVGGGREEKRWGGFV